MRNLTLSVFLLLLAPLAPVWAQTADEPSSFKPDPAKVLRWGKGYRFPQAGWIVVHVEGEPYERGYQHGRLLASEISGYLRCFAQQLNYKAPAEGWKTVRMFSNALFLRKFDQEYLEEMKGIADGATAAGARFDNRPIDVVDIAALNCWAEIESLDQANAATPTGLEAKIFPDPQPQRKPLPRGEHCSAFAATGPATADGKIVFGHITMFGLYPANFYNIWLEIQPTKGHRFVMCSYPAGIQSGMDYYMNDAGLLINETTISQTKFDINGMTCASRIRKAIQYSDNIDKAVEILVKDNNGLYTNGWMLGDINTNEIALLELGTHKHKLSRSSKDEWFGGTTGFYWGCNNIRDMDVRLETIPSAHGKPTNMIYRPQSRDLAWQKFYEKHKGKIGEEFAKEVFTSPSLANVNASLDAKFTTTAMAKQMQTWALFGPPTGKTWNPSKQEKDRFPEIKSLETHPWTILSTLAPAAGIGQQVPVIAEAKSVGKQGGGSNPHIAWRGTLLPQSDADLWLAIAFADYERLVATEHLAVKRGADEKTARDSLEKSVTTFRNNYESARSKLEVALVDVKFSTSGDDWYRLASNKGVLLLHELRGEVGSKAFDKAMDDFGMQHGGKRVTSKQFQAHFEKAIGRNLDAFFNPWLKEKALPRSKDSPKDFGTRQSTAPANRGDPQVQSTERRQVELSVIGKKG